MYSNNRNIGKSNNPNPNPNPNPQPIQTSQSQKRVNEFAPQFSKTEQEKASVIKKPKTKTQKYLMYILLAFGAAGLILIGRIALAYFSH